MKELKVGEIIKVQVIGIQHYGIFIKCIDDESYTGLIHISEISKGYVKDVTQYLHIGERVRVKILDYDLVYNQCRLSLKALHSSVSLLPASGHKTKLYPFFIIYS